MAGRVRERTGACTNTNGERLAPLPFGRLPRTAKKTANDPLAPQGGVRGYLNEVQPPSDLRQSANRLLEFAAVDDAGHEELFVYRLEEYPPVPDAQT